MVSAISVKDSSKIVSRPIGVRGVRMGVAAPPRGVPPYEESSVRVAPGPPCGTAKAPGPALAMVASSSSVTWGAGSTILDLREICMGSFIELMCRRCAGRSRFLWISCRFLSLMRSRSSSSSRRGASSLDTSLPMKLVFFRTWEN